MTSWAQILHLYQPPTQTHDVLERVAAEAYRPLLDVLLRHPGARLAININGVLTKLLREHGMDDVLDRLRTLGERGQVEFLGSGAYHPILPLIPEAAARRSIRDNGAINRELLGPSWHPAGFFPPEMCISPGVVAISGELGYSWLVASGVACPDGWPISQIVRSPEGPRVLFRDDVRSNRIAFASTDPSAFLADLGTAANESDGYVVTALDGETFGHHIPQWELRFLDTVYAQVESGTRNVQMVQPSELLAMFPDGPVLSPRASSWSTTHDDLDRDDPLPSLALSR